jgi:hypothetical protein
MTGKRTLTKLQRRIVLALLKEGKSMTANEIGYVANPDAKPVEGSGHGNGRGSGHRVFGPAQRVIFPLTMLRDRGIVASVERRDGLSGGAYELTKLGQETAIALQSLGDG